MKRLLLATTFAAAAAFAAPAGAATIVHDTFVEFSAITFAPGVGFPAGNPARNGGVNFGNIFDNDEVNTFLSLGRGGTFNAVITPLTNNITSGLTVERTNQGSKDQEQIDVYIGVGGVAATYIGSFLNNNLGGTVIDPAGGPTLSAVLVGAGDAARTQYSISGITGVINTIEFRDVSLATSSDGFDISEFEVTSVSVPEPATLALLGAGLLGLGAAARRRKAA